MPARRRILLVSHAADEHALAVALQVANLGAEPVLADLAALPGAGFSARLGGRLTASVRLGTAGGPAELASFSAGWWRRARRPEPPAGARAGERRLFEGEWRHALDGLAQLVTGVWVNHPARDAVARLKLVQLEAARQVGLPVPRTLVTNDLAEARRFIVSCRGGAVAKSLSSRKEGGLTRRIGRRDQALPMRLTTGPAILQERVDGLDVRVTAVGAKLFAVATDARVGGNPDDVRADWDQAVSSSRPFRLPAELGRRLVALQRILGLAYGAIDLRRRPDGRWAFLEVNPAGQWLQFEQATGQPITEALATLLVKGGGSRG